MMSGGALALRLKAAGARVIELRSRRGIFGALRIGAIGRTIADNRADLVQCWMYHANFAASVLQSTRWIQGPVLWGVRQGLRTLKLERKTTQGLILATVPLSRSPARIVYNSHEGADDHERFGYPCTSRVVIENGTDCVRFRPRDGAKEELCAAIGVPPNSEIIGRVARFAAMKDFATLLEAFSIVAARRPRAHLVIIGPSQDQEKRQLLELAESLGSRERLFILPRRLDIENFYSALDVAVSSSSENEGFPNSVAEALASEVLVVSTNVGASRLIREGCQRVVEDRNPHQLATGMMELLNLDWSMRKCLSQRGRMFVQESYGTSLFARRFCNMWRRTISAVNAQSCRSVRSA